MPPLKRSGRLPDSPVYDVVSALPRQAEFEPLLEHIVRTRARVSVHQDATAYSIQRRLRHGRCDLILVTNDDAGEKLLDDAELSQFVRVVVVLPSAPRETEREVRRREYRMRGAFAVVFAPEVGRGLLECLVDSAQAPALQSRESANPSPLSSSRMTLSSLNTARQLLVKSLRTTLQSSPVQPFSLIVADLDRYRALSSTLPTEGSAALLNAMSRNIREVIQGRDLVAYLGDGRFAVLAQGLDRQELVEGILKAADAPILIDDVPIYTGLSIGVTTSERSYQQPEDAIRDAITAARHAESHTPAIYKTSMRMEGVQELRLEAELRTAVAERGFTLAYQPIVALDTAQLVGFETLLRWTSPTRGFVSPAEFVPVLERTNQIVELGAWILERAAAQGASWHTEFSLNPAPIISVNVSAKQLLDAKLVQHVQLALSESGIEPSCLKLEVTETATIDEPDRVAETLRQCRALGVQVWIDDFGTGYSSLAHVRHFPVDGLKIDKSFVDPIDGTEDGSVMAAAILGIAGSIGASVIAEGIEQEAQAKELVRLGCPYGQGYFFSKPLSLTDAYVKVADASGP